MITIQADRGTNVLETVATRELDAADYDRMLPAAREKIERYGSVRWLFEMKDFDGWTPTAAFRDLAFDVKNFSNFQRIAIVGGKDWMEWATKLMRPFTSAEVKFYTLDQRPEAVRWLAT